ncbi:murein DD-endopeptidase MepM/ murein hydrolase activator NlpD [Microbacteriaceae bacterium SG_E_30_P1]|uniref:Murein DD-endopeptidase MepM/ murein hydrolase activator NlpD n=1 Tax=Antiquaquibacter oligotrophicus TaxID=2880260 RepID=A0ABT6KIR8_9MICO|nr:M23 family metallopeptidase [Antiquaquibacter oligotrophicus]MDH6179819.1 murein DD-endopeptidase MepM/ murein hydrolase activator NlpD [Antiquaquibacter oligotrophicus]UDF14418.1 M23 family metallopeptidase [Antiquaquibacter oligotrophicus]
MSSTHAIQRERRIRRIIAMAAVLATLIVGTIAGAIQPAWAKDYPTWDDVAKVRSDEAATQQQVSAIEALLSQLQADVQRSQQDAQVKGEAWGKADTKFQAAATRAANLQEQADAADASAVQSEQRAGQMAAQLVRAGGGDVTTTLLTGSGDPDALLYGLGMSSKIAEQANAIYARAVQDRNTAQALSDQAEIARDELEVLKIAAEKAFAEAKTAAEKAATALTEQQENQARLQQQLTVLKERRAATEADYLAGVEERLKAGASLGAGEISLSGWAKPVNGNITSSFGYRIPPTSGASSFHQGTDLGAGCGQPIFAAHGGVIAYAGWNGGYGNFVLIDHGGGVQTAYAHIVDGGIIVGLGQPVDVGTQIASVGTTGTSTGCHLHLETRINGVAVDSVPFFAAQGINLG